MFNTNEHHTDLAFESRSSPTLKEYTKVKPFVFVYEACSVWRRTEMRMVGSRCFMRMCYLEILLSGLYDSLHLCQ